MCLPACQSGCLFICLSASLLDYLPGSLAMYLPAILTAYPPVCLPNCLSQQQWMFSNQRLRLWRHCVIQKPGFHLVTWDLRLSECKQILIQTHRCSASLVTHTHTHTHTEPKHTHTHTLIHSHTVATHTYTTKDTETGAGHPIWITIKYYWLMNHYYVWGWLL